MRLNHKVICIYLQLYIYNYYGKCDLNKYLKNLNNNVLYYRVYFIFIEEYALFF